MWRRQCRVLLVERIAGLLTYELWHNLMLGRSSEIGVKIHQN